PQGLRSCLVALVLAVLCVPASADDLSKTGLFRERVLPILRENCLGCHGAAHNSGLDMRTPIDLRKGGVRGAEIVPGAPNKSRLYRYVSGQDPIRMPPGRRLSPQDTAALRDWIAAGATWPTGVPSVDPLPWAYRTPVRPLLPTVKTKGWVKNPIDLFVLARLEAQGLKPAPPADRLTLLRRVTFDLTGLPSTQEAMDAFLRDTSPDAYEKVVDRLLASPSYGERWARHWLDLARYAESEGFKSDEIRPDAWRYRDYVIASLNGDKPYDRFVQEQIAGDELFPGSPEALVATGFNRHGPDESNATNLLQRRQEILNDITDTVGSSLLGLTVGCARCHNHKYDPIPQKDYYRLQAFFAAVRLQTDLPYLTPAQQEAYQTQLKTWEEKTTDVRARLANLEARAREKFFQDRKKRFAPDVQEAIETAPAKRTPLQWILYHKAMPQLELGTVDVKSLKPDAQQAWKDCQQELQKYAALKPTLPVASAITDVGPEAPKTYTLAVGVYNAPREETPPGYLSILAPAPAKVRPVRPDTTGRRAALARWLTDSSNPLTARVMVNRLWQQHFGRGIVGTPSDFGAMGDRPTHPELLDWLATEFMAGGPQASGHVIDQSASNGAWSLKKMHRLMVTSATYRQSAAYNPQAGRLDPENHLLWHYTRRRLEGEAIRDAMLSVSGALNPKMGGPSVFPELPAGITTRGNWKDTKDPQERNRRSIYVFVKRNLRYPLFAAFDMPDTHESCGRRLVTTTAPQALFLLNDTFALQSAQGFAARLLREAGADKDAQIGLAYRLAFSRPPDSEEQASALAFLERQSGMIADAAAAKQPAPWPGTLPAGVSPSQAAALTDLCHALMNSHEFAYTE
ncbi:MAG: hypothetical protein JWL77_4274, partial [Chthonomonadaceae bacterium]|nr:hypothetical protein [Chthonomonadaceae bacterium]